MTTNYERSTSLLQSVCCVAALLLCMMDTGRAHAAKRPNIVIILADDLGYGDLSCYNAESKIPTPHLDKLARQGIRFTDAHSPSAVCTPTRYSLLTGRYCWRTRHKRGVLWPYAMPLIEPNRLTLAGMLKQHGYVTGCIGKWHLGMQWARNDGKTTPVDARGVADKLIDLTKPITAGPLTAGFDSYFGVSVPNFPPYCFIENNRILGPVPDRPKPKSMFGRPGRMQKDWKLENILPTLRQRSVAFIEERSEKEPGRPFLLYLPLTAPHTPIVPSRRFRGKTQATFYGDFVAEVDELVGAVVNAIEQQGLESDTLILFTSDNGSPGRNGKNHSGPLRSVVRDSGHNPSGPWKGIKADIYEGGHRVPFIARWPGKIKAGKVNDALTCHVDVMATVAAIIGHKLPHDAAEDSYNILPLLTGDTLPNRSVRRHVINHSIDGTFAIREGKWKLIETLGSGGWTKPRHVKPIPGGAEGQLYNLTDDPREERNLYLEQPEIVARLSALLEKYRSQNRSRP